MRFGIVEVRAHSTAFGFGLGAARLGDSVRARPSNQVQVEVIRASQPIWRPGIVRWHRIGALGFVAVNVRWKQRRQ